MINGKSLLEWVIPLLLLFCVLFEMLDKIIIVTIICLFISFRINHNQFGNQRVFRINRRLLPRKTKIRKVKNENSFQEQKKHPNSLLPLPLKGVHDDSKDDSDSIHSFDLNEINRTVTKAVQPVLDRYYQRLQDYREFIDSNSCSWDEQNFDDLEIKSLLSVHGEKEYLHYKKDMDQIIKHDNGLYLSSDEIKIWKSQNSKGSRYLDGGKFG
jgi:hypothetical protein